jgi:hypothetical protein
MMFLLSQAAYHKAIDKTVRVPVGMYTQKQFLYKAIAILEGTAQTDTEPQDCIKFDFPELLVRLPRGNQALNYARMCAELRDMQKLAVFDKEGGIAYLIWAMEPNAMPLPTVTTDDPADDAAPTAATVDTTVPLAAKPPADAPKDKEPRQGTLI